MLILTWFPESLTTEFYAIKGILGLIATVLLVFHMMREWRRTRCLSQRMRFISLLAFSVLITGASVEQIQQHALINYRNLGACICILWLVVAIVVSLVHDTHDAGCHRYHRPSS